MAFSLRDDTHYNEIRFMPVCSNCERIIHGYIDVQEVEPLANRDNHKMQIWKEHEIIPWRCPYCETMFERIVMPTKLPFNGY